jgi:hypothetical protein
MGQHTQRVTREIWDALGASIFKGSLLERIEAVLLKDLDDLEKALLNISSSGHNPYVDTDKRSEAYKRGFKDATEAALAVVRERKR